MENKSVLKLKLEDSFSSPIYVEFAEAVQAGNVERMETLLNQKSVELNEKGTLGVTPLFWAMGNLNSLSFLLEQGADPDVVFEDGSSLLQLAIEFADIKIVDALLNAGANTEITTGLFEETAIFAAIGQDLAYAKLLIEADANINAVSSTNNTPMMIAAGRGKFDFVNLMLNHDADCRIKNVNNATIYSVSQHKKDLMDLNHPLGKALLGVLKELESRNCNF